MACLPLRPQSTQVARSSDHMQIRTQLAPAACLQQVETPRSGQKTVTRREKSRDVGSTCWRSHLETFCVPWGCASVSPTMHRRMSPLLPKGTCRALVYNRLNGEPESKLQFCVRCFASISPGIAATGNFLRFIMWRTCSSEPFAFALAVEPRA